MKIDFKNEVLKRKEEIIKSLIELVNIKSDLEDFNPDREGAPFGLGPKKALDFMIDKANKDGFKTKNIDGYAGEINLGNQDEHIAILGHLDVVPAGNFWTKEPFNAKVIDGKIYGRGSEDDKGGTIASYYAMKILKDLKIPLSKRVKLILGTDEESGSRCIKHYLRKVSERPVYGFVPDADFPVIHAEKGIVTFKIEGYTKNYRFNKISAGDKSNMVPALATIRLNADFLYEAQDYLKDNPNLELEYKYDNGTTVLTFKGKSAHASTPQEGDNAIFKLFKFLKKYKVKDKLVNMINDLFIDDIYGEKLGVSYTDKEMGKLTINFGVLNLKNDKYELILNIRIPKGVDPALLEEKVDLKVRKYGAKLTKSTISEVFYNDPNSKLVKTLLDVYKRQTNDKNAKAFSIGGGTYARSLKNTVAFGPHFPGRISTIHQKDEYILIEDLLNATSIYLEAIYELAK